MDSLLTLIALAAVTVGTVFSMLGVLGYVRLPDVFTRLHATGKVSVLGVVLLATAVISVTPLSWSKGMILILFVLLASPVASHSIASAAYRIHIHPRHAQRNDLALPHSHGEPERPSTPGN